MAIVDELNARYGRDRVRFAVAAGSGVETQGGVPVTAVHHVWGKLLSV